MQRRGAGQQLTVEVAVATRRGADPDGHHVRPGLQDFEALGHEIFPLQGGEQCGRLGGISRSMTKAGDEGRCRAGRRRGGGGASRVDHLTSFSSLWPEAIMKGALAVPVPAAPDWLLMLRNSPTWMKVSVSRSNCTIAWHKPTGLELCSWPEEASWTRQQVASTDQHPPSMITD